MFHQPVDLSALDIDDLIMIHARVQMLAADNERKAAAKRG